MRAARHLSESARVYGNPQHFEKETLGHLSWQMECAIAAAQAAQRAALFCIQSAAATRAKK